MKNYTKQTECESHAVNGEHVPAVGHSSNPDWSGYNLCAECIAEYDRRPAVNSCHNSQFTDADARRENLLDQARSDDNE
jgi:hypothetical protein